MSQRHRLEQTYLLAKDFSEEVTRFRKEARGTPPGVERDRLIRRARQAEIGAHINEWLSSPGLKAPTESKAIH
jgi:hypothetical protein